MLLNNHLPVLAAKLRFKVTDGNFENGLYKSIAVSQPCNQLYFNWISKCYNLIFCFSFFICAGSASIYDIILSILSPGWVFYFPSVLLSWNSWLRACICCNITKKVGFWKGTSKRINETDETDIDNIKRCFFVGELK